ncbi:conserved hypothetical protein [Shewanella sediminis HAW-EB3]|uniref:DUF885 domain-containing protein n=1 Tax=Shewanella sediminis (strain HAW-EB3) TaxID=425104 RepID=A8FPU1_SHESH|nr:conserved hypothetical protein [Shewanella sediminis HAW-EB3]
MEIPLPTASQSENERLNELAQSYVKLVLAVGMHDPFYVDAYYGPELWRKECQLVPLSLLDLDAKRLLCELDAVALANADAKLVSRQRFLRTQVASVGYFIRHLQGERGSFDVESMGLYDTQANKFSLESFDSVLTEMAGLLPGEGPLAERFEAFRSGFIVPQNRVPQVFEAAVEKARALTGAHISLPESESFSMEFVNDKIWTAYNWYQGNYQSLIQLNQDQPLYIERCLELASHEGYPGHHVFNLLQEQDLVRNEQWIEYAIYPLYSPISFLSEGSANYGLRLIMSEDEVLGFERDYLMPLAGIEGDIEHYHRVLTCYKRLAYLDNLVCEQLTDGHICVSDAECLLRDYGLYSESRARQRVKFYLSNRAYVINYNHGEESVARWVERGGNTTPVERWRRFEALLRRPLSASQFTI